MSRTTVGEPGSPRRYLHSLWLLSARDLKVRYTTSALGYLWSVLDPLVMSAIYWFVFTQVFHRPSGTGNEDDSYIVFLLVALLPWMWFNTSVSDFTKAFRKDARLMQSTSIPRSIWVNRVVLSKGTEFLFSLPVLAIYILTNLGGVTITWELLWFPVGLILQTILLIGLGMLIAPLCVLYTDLERTTALILRALFYASPVIYGISNLPDAAQFLGVINPLAGIFSLYRVGFFPNQWETLPVIVSAVFSIAVLFIGLRVFRALERPVLKEL